MTENNKEQVMAVVDVNIKMTSKKSKVAFIDLNDPEDDKQYFMLEGKKLQKRGRKYFIDCLKSGRINIKNSYINEQIINLCKKYAKTKNPDSKFILEVKNAYKECAAKFGIEDEALIAGIELRMELPLIAKVNEKFINAKVSEKVKIVNKKLEGIREKEQILEGKELGKKEKEDKEELEDRKGKLNNILDSIQKDLKELGCEQITIQR